MFDTLIESSARPTRRAGGTTVSMLVHGTIVGLGIIMATPTPRAVSRVPHDTTTVTWLAPRSATPVAPSIQRDDQPTRRWSPADLLQPVPSAPTVTQPTALPEVGRSLTPIGSVTPAGSSSAPPGLPVSPAGNGSGAGEPRDEATVEVAPRLLGGAPAPVYPVALRRAGIEGRVLAQFVVDTLGRIEPENVEMLESAHAMLASAVREALSRYRFTPGEAGGRRVRTRVQVPFDFRLSR